MTRNKYWVVILAALILTWIPAKGWAQIDVSLPDLTGDVGETASIPITVSDLVGSGVYSFDFSISYDPTVLTIGSVHKAGTLSEGMTVEWSILPGQINVSAASVGPLIGIGTLIRLEGDYIGAGISDLTFDTFMFNEGVPAVNLTDGSVSVGVVQVRLPDVASDIGVSGVIPIYIAELTDEPIFSYDFRISYDPAIITITGVDQAGTLSADWTVEANPQTGMITVSAAGAIALTGEGILLNLLVDYEAFGNTDLVWDSFIFNEGLPPVSTIDGSVVLGRVDVVLPDVIGELGKTGLIPITVPDLTGDNVVSYDFELTYNADIIDIFGVEKEGTLSADMDIVVNLGKSGSVGTLTVSAAGAYPLVGAGTLLYLTVDYIGAGPSPLNWVSFMFNEGEPPARWIDGSVWVNRAPYFVDVLENTVIDEMELLAFDYDAEDDDGDELTFALVDEPEGAVIDAVTGELTWTPTYEQAGDYTLTVVVTDGMHTDTTAADVTVNNVNRAPEFTAVMEDQEIDEDELLAFTYTAEDPDGDFVTFALVDPPDGAVIDDTTGEFSWTPDFFQAGEWEIIVSIDDGYEDKAVVYDTAAVVVLNVNRKPVFVDVLAAQEIDELAAFAFTYTAEDPDLEEVSFSGVDLPDGAAIDAATGEFTWTPTEEQVGDHTITAVVTDGDLTDTTAAVLTVVNVHPDPVVLNTWWQRNVDDFAYFQNDHMTRGADYNPVDDHYVVASRTGSHMLYAVNAVTGHNVKKFNMTGVSGGTYHMNLVSVADDGAIYACNLVAFGFTTTTFKIYRWADHNAAPTVAFEGYVDARTGDGFNVVGSGANTVIYASGSTSTKVYVFTTTDGETFTVADEIPVPAGAARMGIAPVAVNPGADIWINGAGTSPTLVDTAGNILAEIGGDLLSSALGSVDYVELAKGTKLVAVGGGNDATWSKQAMVWDVTDLEDIWLYAYGELVLDTFNANTNGTGVVSLALHNDGTWNLFQCLSNNGLANYSLEEWVAPELITIAEARYDRNFAPELLGDVVTVEGVLTTPNFQPGANTDYFIQDETAGIKLFKYGPIELAIGWKMRVTGQIQQYRGVTEIVPANDAAIVPITADNDFEIKTVLLSAVGEDLEGSMLRLNDVWVVDRSKWPPTGSNGGSVYVTDGSDTVQVYIDKDTDIDGWTPPMFFDVIGPLDQYSTATPPNNGYELRPRFQEDFIPKPEALMSLEHTPGDLTFGIFNDGSIAAENVVSTGSGPGINWKGQNGAYLGSVIFGSKARGMVNGHLGSFKSLDPTTVGDLVNVNSAFVNGFTSDDNFDQIAVAVLSDAGAPNPYGVDIVQYTASNTGEEFGLLGYGFINRTSTTIKDFYAGVFIDFDVDANTYQTNSGGYDFKNRIVYVYDKTSPSYYGIVGLNWVTGMRLSNIWSGYVDGNGVRTASFEYISTIDATPPPSETDLRAWIGSKLDNLAPGDTVWINFGLVAGDDLAGLQANAEAALAKAAALGWGEVSIDEPPVVEIPDEYSLSNNYPNPFNPTTNISYALPFDSNVQVTIYNMLGEVVAELVNTIQPAGHYQINWNAGDKASGIYFFAIKARSADGQHTFQKVNKMMLVK